MHCCMGDSVSSAIAFALGPSSRHDAIVFPYSNVNVYGTCSCAMRP